MVMTKELWMKISEADAKATSLSAHCALFDGFYSRENGLEQAQLDPECFFASWNEIYEKVDALYGVIRDVNRMMQGKE